MSKFQVNNDRSRDYTVPINTVIQPSIFGQHPPGQMPGAAAAPPYNGAQYPGQLSSGGWAATASPPQHMHMQMPMQNYPYMTPGVAPPGPPGTMPPGSMPQEMRPGPGSMYMQNPNGLPQPPAMPPYRQ